jgi:hypothetical protein
VTLTWNDKRALLRSFEGAANPTERIHTGRGRGALTHFRLWRLVDLGLAYTMPPRLSDKGLATARLLKKDGFEK